MTSSVHFSENAPPPPKHKKEQKEKQKKGGKNQCILRLTTRQQPKPNQSKTKNGRIKQKETKVLEAERLTFVEVHDR